MQFLRSASQNVNLSKSVTNCDRAVRLLGEARLAPDRHPQHHIRAAGRHVVHAQRTVQLRRHQRPHDLQAQPVRLLQAETVGQPSAVVVNDDVESAR